VSGGAVVPQYWFLEVGAGLLAAERRARLTAAEVRWAVALIEALPIKTDDGTALRALREITDLAREHGLTSYDTAYLELAIRRGATLATLDGDLPRSARSVGVASVDGASPVS
jgi:predicted nucleic acid-binding protein